MSKEQMMIEKVIRTFGFENANTIFFCKVCEEFDNDKRPFEEVEEAYRGVMSFA